MLFDLFISAFATLFVVIDPPGCAPIYAGLTARFDAAHRRAMAIRACLVACAILLFFALLGQRLLSALHIGLDAFRIAGGIMLFLIALDMVFEKRTQRREQRAEQVLADPAQEDVSIFPMAMPMLAGPGAIATVMLLQSNASGVQGTLVVLAALGLVLAMTLGALLAAGPLMKAVGPRFEAVLTRLLGVLLAALAAQYVIDGVNGSF